jgi:hypothetical protein
MRGLAHHQHENGFGIVSAVILLFSVDVKVIFIAEDLTGVRRVARVRGCRYCNR